MRALMEADRGPVYKKFIILVSVPVMIGIAVWP